jgi:tryptophan synthase beta chain
MIQIDEKGFYGKFGGAYIPEMLHPNIEELRENWEQIVASPDFQEEFQMLLRDFVAGRRLCILRRGFRKSTERRFTSSGKIFAIRAPQGQQYRWTDHLGQKLGKKRIIAETGAGQHGVATATVCALMGMDCTVYMGALDIQRQRPNVERMKILGAKVVPATSGSQTLKDATNEAMRQWINNPVDTHYIIGSVVGPHPYPEMVARFQSVISQEIKSQLLEKEGTPNPDIVIACVGGGSNAAGAFYHYYNVPQVRLVAAEAAGLGINSGKSAATTVLGTPGVLHGSKTLLMQTEDGQVVEPHSISAGLDYPGIGPVHAHLHDIGRAEFVAVEDEDAMKAGIELSRLEGIIPAIESAHAIHALNLIQYHKDDVIVINLSGRGDKDLETYIKWGGY